MPGPILKQDQRYRHLQVVELIETVSRCEDSWTVEDRIDPAVNYAIN